MKQLFAPAHAAAQIDVLPLRWGYILIALFIVAVTAISKRASRTQIESIALAIQLFLWGTFIALAAASHA